MGATVMESPGMHAHRIEVFNGADNDAVVRLVAHDLHFKFLPAQKRFFDQNFRNGRQLQPAPRHDFKFLAIIGNAAARAAQGVGRADDQRETPDALGHGARFLQIMGRAADGHIQPDGEHEVLENLAVLAALDGGGVGADHFHAVFFQRAASGSGPWPC